MTPTQLALLIEDGTFGPDGLSLIGSERRVIVEALRAFASPHVIVETFCTNCAKEIRGPLDVGAQRAIYSEGPGTQAGRAGAAPAPSAVSEIAEKNQCDGCQRGLPTRMSKHGTLMHDGQDTLPVMACTADRYVRPDDKSSEEIFETLKAIEDTIWQATGSAFLSGEKYRKDDANIIRSSLCVAGNQVAFVRDELAKAARSSVATNEAWSEMSPLERAAYNAGAEAAVSAIGEKDKMLESALKRIAELHAHIETLEKRMCGYCIELERDGLCPYEMRGQVDRPAACVRQLYVSNKTKEKS